MRELIPIAASEDVTIHCQRDGKYSFFNSPYPSHQQFIGLDIYSDSPFGDVTASPVEGKMILKRKIRCPQGRGFKETGFDVVTLIQSLENPDRIVKILHLDPVIRTGEKVEPGQKLGRLLRSGYFNFWTDPHIHLEVKDPSDPLRARGGFRIAGLVKFSKLEPIKEMTGTVTQSTPEYSLCYLKEKIIHGVTVKSGTKVGLLDGGIPHYGWLGVHSENPPSVNSSVLLCSRPIATTKTVVGNMCLAKCKNFNVAVNDVAAGLSFYLYPSSKPEIKLVPKRIGALTLEESQEISLTLI